MALMVACTSCQQRLTFPDHFAGKEVQCPTCMADFPIPADAPKAPEAPAKAAAPKSAPPPGNGQPRPAVPKAPTTGAPRPATSPAFQAPGSMPPVPSGIKKPQGPGVHGSGGSAPPGAVKKPAPTRPPVPKVDAVLDDDALLEGEAPFISVSPALRRSSSGKGAFIALLAVLLLAGLGVGGYFLFFAGKTDDKPDPGTLAKKDEEKKKDLDSTGKDEKKKTEPKVIPAVDPPGGKDPVKDPGKDPGKDPPVVAKAGTEVEPSSKVDLKQHISKLRMDRAGKFVYALLGDSSVHQVNLADLKSVEVMPPHARKSVFMGDIAVSPDGKTLARAQAGIGIDLMDLAAKDVTTVWMDKTSNYGQITFGPDNRKLYVQMQGAVFCLDVVDKKQLYEIRGPDGIHLTLTGWGLSPDGNVIAGGDGECNFYLFDARDGRMLHQSKALDFEMLYAPNQEGFAFSPDGKKAACNWQKFLHVWHLPSQKQRPTIEVGKGLENSHSGGAIAFFQNGERLAVATNRGKVFLFDVLTGQRRAILQDKGDLVFNGLALTPDDKLIAAAHGNQVALWNLDLVVLGPPDAALAAIPDPTDVVKVDPPMKDPGPKKSMPGEEVKYDQFGNPQGKFGLARTDEFKGKKVLVWVGASGETEFMVCEDNPIWVSLRRMGFEVILKDGPFPHELLDKCDQLWIFSGSRKTFGPDPDKVADFVKAGKGLYLMADNDPYFVEANEIGRALFGTFFQGDYVGQKIAFVNERKMNEAFIRKFGGQFAISDHPLFTGVNLIYEGMTLSHFQETASLKPFMFASDGKPLIGISQLMGTRVVVDCGYTRYFYNSANPKGVDSLIARAAGTVRFGENVAAFLGGKGRLETFAKFDPPLREMPFKGKDPFMPKFPVPKRKDPFVPKFPDPLGVGEKLTSVGKIDAFHAGWVDPESKKALLVGKGGLKVFSYPEFKPKAAWKMPGLVQRAVFDKTKGLMYALVPNFKGKDPSTKRGASQVLVFEVRDVMDGKIKPTIAKDLLSPVQTINLPDFCTHLSISPDGEWLYLLENRESKSARAVRVGAVKGEVSGAAPLHEVSDGLALSADGKNLVAISHVGLRSGGKALTGKLQVIDPASMKLVHTIDVPLDPYDVDVANDGTAFLPNYGTKGEIAIVDTAKKEGGVLAVWKGLPGSSCVKLEDSGMRLFVRNAKTTPSSAACLPLPENYTDSELPRVPWGPGLPVTARGDFLLTPDGRFLICESGLVYLIGAGEPGPFGGGIGGFPAP